MTDATSAYLRLTDMVRRAEARRRSPKPRTEAEEDLIALEDLILLTQGPDALEAYQARQDGGLH